MLTPPASLWWSTLKEPVAPRPALSSHLDVDVAVVGGGFTGLWTARELVRRDPSVRVAVLEQSVCGFGASGRNGGWASALFPVSHRRIIDTYGREAFDHQRRTLQHAVSDLGAAAAADGIDAHFAHGGSLTFARSETQRARLMAAVAEERTWGVSDDDLTWLDADHARERGRLSDVHGATFTPHCARIHPARLVRGLSDVCEQLGVRIFESTSVTRLEPRQHGRRARVITPGGVVTADVVVRATEGFTSRLPGARRDWAPVYSLMVATAPLSPGWWDDVGFSHYETFADDRHLIIYGQRTEDDRIAFGGRGAPSTSAPRSSHASTRVPGCSHSWSRRCASCFRRSTPTSRTGGADH